MARVLGLIPPPPARSTIGLIVSFAFHAALALPFVLPRPVSEVRDDPVDRFVVFLVPPDEDASRVAAGRAIPWSALSGTGGEIPDLPPEPTEALFTQGRASAPDTAVPEPEGEVLPPIEEALTEIEVDSVVERDPLSAAPVYPPEMLQKNIEGSTFVHYVVDTAGRVDTTTIRVVRSTHPAFAQAVREALALMRFRPAIQRSRKVRQWVEQNFSFKIVPRPTPDTT